MQFNYRCLFFWLERVHQPASLFYCKRVPCICDAFFVDSTTMDLPTGCPLGMSSIVVVSPLRGPRPAHLSAARSIATKKLFLITLSVAISSSSNLTEEPLCLTTAFKPLVSSTTLFWPLSQKFHWNRPIAIFHLYCFLPTLFFLVFLLLFGVLPILYYVSLS